MKIQCHFGNGKGPCLWWLGEVSDSVAGLLALQRTGERLSQGATQILVGGAESCLDPRVLLSTRTPPLRTEESSGIVLGEGAAFVALGPRMPNMVQILVTHPVAPAEFAWLNCTAFYPLMLPGIAVFVYRGVFSDV